MLLLALPRGAAGTARDHFLQLLLAACAILVTCCATMYDDEQQASSWMQSYVGGIRIAALPQHMPFVVAASQDHLALLDRHNGNMRWRRQVHADTLCVQETSDRIISLSGGLVQAWRMTTGQMMWQRNASDDIFTCCSDSREFYWMGGGILYAYGANEGSELWSKEVASGRVDVMACHVSKDTITIAYSEEGHEKRLSVAFVAAHSQSVTSADAELQMVISHEAVLADDLFVAVSEDKTNVCSAVLSSLNSSACCVPLPAKDVDHAHVTAMYETGAVVSAATSDGLAQFSYYPSEPRLTLLKHATGVTSRVGHVKDLLASATVISPSNLLSLTIVNASNGDIIYDTAVESDSLLADGTKPKPVSLWAVSVPGHHNDSGFRFLLRMDDDSLVYIVDGIRQWVRNEALANVEQILITDTPAHRSEMRNDDVTSRSFSNFLYRTALGFWESLHSSVSNVMAGQAKSASSSLKEDDVRHAHGLDKIILAATSNGMMFALENVNGLPIWKTAVPYFHLRLVVLLEFKVQDDTSSSNSPDLKIMMVRAGDQGSVITLFNPVNGKIVSVEHVSMCVTHVQPVDHARSRAFLFAQVLKPFPEAIPVSIYPSSVIHGPHHHVTVWASDKETGYVVGYEVRSDSEGLKGTKSWTLDVHAELKVVQQVQHLSSHANHVKIQADRSLRFRYLNPNMVVVVAERKAAYPRGGITAVVVDAVTGRVLHSQNHPHCYGPVSVAFFDNRLFLQFWEEASSRWQLSVLEFYDHTVSHPSLSSLIFGTVGGHFISSEELTSYSPVILEVLRQSFYMRTAVRSMLPTSTRFGVTPRRLLLTTQTDQVLDLDLRLVDPRRPMNGKATSAQRDERLLAYTPQLMITGQAFATYDRTVADVRSIAVAPAVLESTLHMLAWGRDMYYGLMRPSQGFDMLGDDFSYTMLSVSLISMTAAVMLIRGLVSHARISTKWE